MKEAIDFYAQSWSATNLCAWAEAYSRMVWHRIHYARSTARMRVFETTITQNLIFDLVSKRFPAIGVWEAKDETANGDDIEVVIEIHGVAYVFAVQCKIAYKNEVFEAFWHEVINKRTGVVTRQIDLLCNYARSINGIPAYMLYSFRRNGSSKNDEYGVSMAGAHFLLHTYGGANRRRKKPTVAQMISGISIPLPIFLCSDVLRHVVNPRSLPRHQWPYAWSMPFLDSRSHDYAAHEIAEFREDRRWRPIETWPGGDGISTASESIREPEFRPKYRIVFGSELRD